MANKNFVVKNGLTVGNLTVDANHGGLTTTGNIVSGNIVATGSITATYIQTNQIFYANGTPFVGYVGSKGDAGFTGSAGYTGSTGMGFIVGRTYTSVAELLADTEPGIQAGQFAVVETGNVQNPENSRLYLWNGTNYQYVTDLSGAAGITGPQGFTGSAGAAGNLGFTGSAGAGFTGSAGTTGFTGSVGSAGSTGFTGSRGTDGVIGVDGYTGSRGDTGFTGSTGSTGFAGSRGADGTIGVDGYTGSKGDAGFTGSIGTTGFVGSQGIQGFTGSQGNAGGAEFVFQNVGFNYSVDGYTGSYPTLTLVRGQLYYFNLTNITSGHPLALRLSSGNTSAVPGTTGNNPTSGAFGDGSTPTVVTYRVPFDAPSSIVYQCIYHSGMIGTINIVDQTGYTGSAGTNGFTGSAGVAGFVGSAGSTGTAGFTGSTGATGFTGSFGSTGFVGSAGQDGDRYHTTSTTTLTIASSGQITLVTTDLYLDYSTQQTLIIAYNANNHMHGEVNTYNPNTGQLVVDLTNSTGSGTYNSWEINLDGAVGIQGFTGSAGAGFTGSTGSTGFTGSAGTNGFTGSVGAGFVGSVGFTGSSGTNGFTGSSGAGFTGSQGIQGLPGALVSGTVVDTFTSNGSVSSFTLSVAPISINATIVAIDGILQEKSTYSVSGFTLTLTEPLVTGEILEVTTLTYGTTNFVTRAYTGNGSTTAFTVTNGVTVNSIIVTENGVVQAPSADYTISGPTLTFTTAPAAGVAIGIREIPAGAVGFTGSSGSGFTGSGGSLGFTGSAGTNGFTGSAGAGFTGSAGAMGFAGSAGAGFTGSAGTNGFTGSAGGAGFTGSAGAGFTGSSGTNGFTGSAGTDGFTGSAGIGFTGSAGTNGFTGSAGAAGSQGPIGFTGSAGTGGGGGGYYYADVPPNNPLPGDRWFDTTIGILFTWVVDEDTGQWIEAAASGFLGQTGYAGSIGSTGFTGSVGFSGSQGIIYSNTAPADTSTVWFDTSSTFIAAGYTGSAGSTGFVGSRGTDGTIGVDGFTGSRGDTGFTGSSGAFAAVGFTGSASTVPGFTGSQGPIGFTGSAPTTIDDGSGNFYSIGFKEAPQNLKSTGYTLVNSDNGKHVYYTGGAATLTIPTDASTTGGAFPIGTTIVVVNNGSGSLTISSSATVNQAGTSNTGSRTLATKGMASILKVAADTWFISGTGLT